MLYMSLIGIVAMWVGGYMSMVPLIYLQLLLGEKGCFLVGQLETFWNDPFEGGISISCHFSAFFKLWKIPVMTLVMHLVMLI